MPSSKLGQASITIRCTADDKRKITKKWQGYGFKSESEYIRFVALNAEISIKVEGEKGE
jgi:diphthamide synthase (EF-2-diphthine--ammonia ligase)